jgi:hypothetical protein
MTKISGKVEAVLITPKGENISNKIEGGIFTNEGLIGDRHSGVMSLSRSREPEFPLGSVIRNRRQISLVSQEELVQIAETLGVEIIKPDWLAANLLISGIRHFTQLPVGARFFFEGGLVLFNDGENNPCHIPAKTVQNHYEHIDGIQKEFVIAAMHKRGLLAWVEHPGTLMAGAGCTVELPPVWKDLWQETN